MANIGKYCDSSHLLMFSDEDEYMCHRRSPFDVLAPGMHSPDLQQMEFRRPQLDLLQYDPAASSGYAGVWLAIKLICLTT